MKGRDLIDLAQLLRTCGYECKGFVTVFLPKECPPSPSPKREAPSLAARFCESLRSSEEAISESFARRG